MFESWVEAGADDVPRETAAQEQARFLLEAQREVDAMLPHTPPIAPQPSPTYRRDEWLASLRVPDAHAAEAMPRCTGPGSCGYHHRKGIPCGRALLERRPPPPSPQRLTPMPEPRDVHVVRDGALRPEPPPLPAPDFDLFETYWRD